MADNSLPATVTHEQAREAYKKLHDHVYCSGRIPTLSVPPQPTDVDIVLCNYIEQQAALSVESGEGAPADALCHSFGAAMSGVTGAHQPTHNAVLHCQACDKPVLECWCFSSEGLIDLPPEVEEQCVLWAKDDRLWTTGETVRLNLRAFARVVIRDTNRRKVDSTPPLYPTAPIGNAAISTDTLLKLKARIVERLSQIDRKIDQNQESGR